MPDNILSSVVCIATLLSLQEMFGNCRSDSKWSENQTTDTLLAQVGWLLQDLVYTHSFVLFYGSNTIIVKLLESNKWEA